MLPEDTSARKKAAHSSAATLDQSTLDAYTRPIETPPPAYSDDVFGDAAIDWTIATDQVCLSLVSLFSSHFLICRM